MEDVPELAIERLRDEDLWKVLEPLVPVDFLLVLEFLSVRAKSH
jgi:hypothetical protein